MENKSRNRIKAFYDHSFEHWISNIKISTNTETHIIGLGSGDANAVNFIRSQWVKGRFTVVNNHDSADIPTGINLIPFHLSKNR